MGEAVGLPGGPTAWRAAPTDARRGGLVICHAIWGVTPHLRDLAVTYAEVGYETLVPNLFERFGQDFAETDTEPALMGRQTAYAEAADWGAATMPAIQSAVDALQPPVFLMGFCFGGTAAWLAAARCRGLSAVAAYYGGGIPSHLDEAPQVPTILHLGKHDELILPPQVDAITGAYPDLPVYLYDAGHAFVAPSGHHADSARLSTLRTLQHFARHGGGRGEA